MEENKKQERKKYSKEGVAQKKMTIKIDNSVLAWLKSKANMGRYINELIRKDIRESWKGSNWPDPEDEGVRGWEDYEDIHEDPYRE